MAHTKNIFAKTAASNDQLTPNKRLLLVFLLGVGAGLTIGYQHGSLLWVSLCCLLLAVILTIKLRSLWAQAYAITVFLVGVQSIGVFYYPNVMMGILTSILAVLVLWALTWAMGTHALSDSWLANQRPYSYWSRAIIWVVLAILGLSLPALIIVPLIVLIIIKLFQLIFMNESICQRKIAFAYSVGLPVILGSAVLGYQYYQAQLIRTNADQLAQQILAYHRDHGQYPPDEEALLKSYPQKQSIRYFKTNDEPSLFYADPSMIFCSYHYNFNEQQWTRFCD